MTTAVLDACVLYRGVVTDFLLNAADQGLFDPIWSPLIADEWTRNLEARGQIPAERIARRRQQMDDAFPGATCPCDSEVLNRVLLHCRTDKERKDAHVIATAVTADASVIVTHNLKDFPDHVFVPFAIAALKPDTFFCRLAAVDPVGAAASAKAHRLSMKKPSLLLDEYLALLKSPKAELHNSATWLEATSPRAD